MHRDAIDVLCPQEESYHNRLALAYVAQTLQEEEETETDARVTRKKLQQLLWESRFYDVSTVYGVWMCYMIIITVSSAHYSITVSRFPLHCRESKVNTPAPGESHSPW